MTLRCALLALCLLPNAAMALTPALPAGAVRVLVEAEEDGSLRLPITAWQPGGSQTLWAEGRITRAAWQLDAERKTTLQLLRPLRRQLKDAGYEILFQCRDRGCGGFDFRYSMNLLPEPEMHVDLGDYRYLAAQRMGETSPEYVMLMVSRAAGRGFVQVTEVFPPGASAAPTDVAPAAEAPRAVLSTSAPATRGSGTIATLVETGRAVLDDLTFDTGSSRLSEGAFDSLAALADYLAETPSARIVLVGHTDAEGSLSGNLSLSRARATAVLQRLSRDHGVAPGRMQAEGVGFLAPIANNATEAGRERNRRVEVVLADQG